MIPTGQYIAKKSFLHSLDPRTALFLLMQFAIIVLIKAQWWNHIAAFIMLLLATSASKAEIRKVVKILWTFRFFIAITFIIHLLFTPGEGISYNWKFIHISGAGVWNGLLFSSRIAMFMWAAALFGWVVSPVALGDALEKLFAFVKNIGIHPRDISMLVLLAMRFVPTLMDDAKGIRWAQFARGGQIKGGIFKQARQVVPMVIPLFVCAFRRADKLALALELRAYNPCTPRTKLSEIDMKIRDFVIIAAMTSITAAAIFLAIAT